ncbi:hypothetical protein HA402_004548 [Bradysia odoriphaga]|nr:hypothetical protein HA402_004548 [Bradysia odoriphaga]
MTQNSFTANHRAKRQRIDKHGRFAALAKLKELKGSKHKYEISEDVDNVYDEVDEQEYSNRVTSRALDDWIEDDGTGYVEDGREIFDDDEEDLPRKNVSKTKRSDKKRVKDIGDPVQGKGSIKSLFGNAVPKKKDSNVKLEDDNILADILCELDGNAANVVSATSHSTSSLKAVQEEKKAINDYMASFSKNVLKKRELKEVDTASDDEILEKILKPAKVIKTDVVKSNALSANTRATTVKSVPRNVFKIEDPKVVEETKMETTNGDTHEMDHFGDDDDIDFSVLETDDLNLVENASVAIKVEEPVTKQIDSPDAKLKSAVKTSDIFANIRPNWDSAFSMEDDDDADLINAVADVTDDVMMTDDKQSDMKFWYWDAWEDPNNPGQIFLFGKIAADNKNARSTEYKSICVKVENVDHCIYVLPREFVMDTDTNRLTKTPVTMKAVYEEFRDSIAKKNGIGEFRSKPVTKNFAFSVPDVNVPMTCEYLEVRYDGRTKPIDMKYFNNKYKTVAHIFGTNASSLETFLLHRKIKGPCWLSLKDYKINDQPMFSWCKSEMTVPNIQSISVNEAQSKNPPPVAVATVNVRSSLNPNTIKNEAPRPQFQKHFCGYTRPKSQNWPLDIKAKHEEFKITKIVKADSERELLSWFLATFKSIDPDLIVVNDANDCQLDVIWDRINNSNISNWSCLGRLKFRNKNKWKWDNVIIGRMVCDVKSQAEQLHRSLRSYDLGTLCVELLKTKEEDHMQISNDDLYAFYETGAGVMKLITLTMNDCMSILRLMCEMNVLPLALQLTNICGNLMGKTLMGASSERIEYLLLHAFFEKDYIVPDKRIRQKSWETNDTLATETPAAGKKKPQYAGGMVLEPIKGFYDTFILLMDFNSLYPSIIQEYNICFTTVTDPVNKEIIPDLPDPGTEQGILPKQIRRLVESRRDVKKLMANPDLKSIVRMQYHTRQQALKLTANSMYGCLGFANSRFRAQHLGALVTAKGREILMNTKSLVQKMNFEVIYGDTDSIMINSNCVDYDQVIRIGQQIKQAVNKVYKEVELDIDGVFKCMLLLKKKKYGAVTISKLKSGEFETCQQLKGLDIVRRDWSQVAIMAGKLVVEELFNTDRPIDDRIDTIHSHLETFKRNIEDDVTPLPLFNITQQLKKMPKDYTNVMQNPHVQIALRLNANKTKRFKKGDTINYIICDDGTDKPPMQRGYHMDEFKTNPKLKVDKLYYLEKQIHPIVTRLVEPIEGTDASRIATFLGLDSSKYIQAARRAQQDRADAGIGESVIKSSLQKYRYCKRFTFKCRACKTENVVASAFKKNEAALQQCSNPECNDRPYEHVAYIQNQLTLTIRQCISRFYENWLVCDEPTCNSNTRTYTHVTVNNRPVCRECKTGFLLRQYSESELNDQISYFRYMFDLEAHSEAQIKVPPQVEATYKILKDAIDQILSQSAYCVIKLSKLFERLQPVPKQIPSN